MQENEMLKQKSSLLPHISCMTLIADLPSAGQQLRKKQRNKKKQK